MSTKHVNNENLANKTSNWDVLIEHSEAKIVEFQKKVYEMRKSLKFFKKQRSSGIPFPLIDRHRHE
jgi:hypothetical protein